MTMAVTPKHDPSVRKVKFEEPINPRVSSDVARKADDHHYADHSQAVASKSSVTDMSIRRAN